MGKDKTKSNSIGHNSNGANKTIGENKENSVKNSLRSGKSSKKSSNLNSTISEVLEDEITSDSTTSSYSKASNSSNNTTINSSSTSTSKTTSSTRGTTSKVQIEKKSSKLDKKDKKEDQDEKLEKEVEDEKVDKKSPNPEKKDKGEDKEEEEEEEKEETEEDEVNKKSPKPGKEDEEKEEDEVNEKIYQKSPKKGKEDKEEQEDDKVDKKSSKPGEKDKDEDKEGKDTQKKEDKDGKEGNTDKKEEQQFRIASNSNNNTGFKLRIVPLEKLLQNPPKKQEAQTEQVKSTQLPLKRERDKSFESSSKNQQIRRLPKRSNKPVSFVEISDSESNEENYSDSSKDVPIRTAAKRKSVKKGKFEDIESSEPSEDALPIKVASKRQTATKEKSKDIESIISSESSDDVLPIKRQSVTKDKSKDKESVKSSESSDDALPIKTLAKRQAVKTSKSRPQPPPSPSSIKRCVVNLKRTKLSDFKNHKTSSSKNKKNNMNGKTEKPSTSSARRKRLLSDDDSDFDGDKASAIDDDEPLDSQGDSSDSEIIPKRKRRVFQKDNNSGSSDDDLEQESKQKNKRRRIKNNSSDESDDEDEKKDKTKRKDIRKIIKTSELNISTKTATKEEEERRKRIEERQKIYNEIYEKPDSVEVTELVLDFDTETRKSLLEVDKGLMKKLKPHQVTGVKFMWDACFETLQDAKEKPGSGCILAHCMGLGKTMQICTLSHTLLANSAKTGVERVLIISPLSTLNNWAREFKQWIGFTRKRNIEIYDMSKYKDKNTRIFKLNEWFEEGGVCIMGYDMYRILTNEKAKGLRKKQREHLHQSLVDPGPDMVVCDEGHLLKNEKTSISKAVTRMRTLRRIVLTGTPLQNNLKEYYCMIQFIKPNLLGTYKEYLNRFVNPITNGQYADSTERDMRLMKHRSHILHQLLQGCIQRRDYSVLAPYLPPKHEYVVYTTLSIVQQYIYEHYMTQQRDVGNSMSEGKGARLFQDFQELRRIWTHPMNMRINSDSVIRKKVLANETDSMDDFIDDEDDAVSSDSSVDSSKSFGSGGGGGNVSTKKAVKTRNSHRNAAENVEEMDSDIEEVKPVDQDDPSEWWKRFVSDKELNNINHSPKLVILMSLLEQCEIIGDKLLVFSQSLQSLDTIEHFLSLIDSKTRGYEYDGDVGEFKGFWKPGADYFRLDGSCSVEQRENMCRKFNDSTNLRARLFLISTRAGGLGINLVAANRVVIFDVSWNPSHDTQSIFRVYRFGQTKPCYIYRLIAMGTMEQKLYERQVAKQATAKRVIDEQQISRHYNQSDLQELYTYELKPSVPREIPILPKDRLFAELLSKHDQLLFKYHEHDSLLENEESENLSEAERKEAWSEFEAEKTRAVQTTQFMAYDRGAFGNQFGNAAGSVTSNKIFGFRSDVLLQLLNMKIAKDHPEMTQNQVIQVVPAYLNELYSQMNNGDPTLYKDLLTLNATLIHPSGMYMSPLLYVNQNPGAAGYYQANNPMANGVMVPNPMPQVPIAAKPAPGFDPNEVYEID